MAHSKQEGPFKIKCCSYQALHGTGHRDFRMKFWDFDPIEAQSKAVLFCTPLPNKFI